MRLRKKILLSLSVIVLLFLTALCVGILYLYDHPSAVKPFIEKSISRFTGTSFTIKTLSYSLRPFQIEAKEILIRSVEGPDGNTLTIPDLIAELALRGPFGRKTLILKTLKIDGFSFQLSDHAELPKMRMKGKAPNFFSKILKEAVGLFLLRDIKFQAAEIKGGEVTARWKDEVFEVREMEGTLTDDGPIAITGSVLYKRPSIETEFFAPHFRIKTDATIDFDDPIIKGTLSAPDATLHSPQATVKNMDINAHLTYVNKQKSLTLDPLDLVLRELVLKQREAQLKPFDLHFSVDGIVNLDERKLNADHLNIMVDDVFQLVGQASAHMGPQKDVRLKILDSRILLSKLLPLLPETMSYTLAPAALSGPVSLKGHIEGLKESEKWAWQYDLEAKLKENLFSYATPSSRFNTRLTGSIKTDGRFPDINLFIQLKGTDTLLSNRRIRPAPFTWELNMSGKHPQYLIGSLQADIPAVKFVAGVKENSIEGIRLRAGQGKLDVNKRFLSLPDIRLQTALITNLSASLEGDPKKVVMALNGEDTNIMEAVRSMNLLPEGWRYKGRDFIKAKVILREKGDISLASKFSLKSFEFQNPDGSAVGENITISGDINGSIDPKHSSIAFNATLQIPAGEILYDRYYFDLNKNALFSSYDGNYDIAKKTLRLSKLSFGLNDLITLYAQGKMVQKKGADDIQLQVNVPEAPLQPVFRHLVLEPFKAERPFLTSLTVGGSFSTDFKVMINGHDRRVTGHYVWYDGELLSEKMGFSLKGIELDLPIWYQTGESKKGTNPIKGRLYIRSMTLPLLPEQPLETPLMAGPNRVFAASPTTLRAEQGMIQWGPFTCSDLFSPSPLIETSLTLNAVGLSPFLSKIWSRSIQGTLNGTLKPIQFKGKTLTSEGEIEANVFGGEIVFSKIGASGLFSSTPLLKLSARFDDLHLDQLTRDTSFGRIEGILTGRVLDLEIADKQPQKFDLLLETVEKKDIDQRISIKAVDNIARIGGGQSPFMGLAGVITSFFKEFPYKKIGVHATLDNDIFRIHGTIKEDGKEFLVKRSGLSGVNVINQNPDNRIRFQDMVKRIKRIVAGNSGPVIE
jgi:hypothetical protein